MVRAPDFTKSQVKMLGRSVAILLLCSGGPAAQGMSDPVAQTQPFRAPPGMTIIFGKDNRTRVSDTTVFPFSAIGHVVCDYGYALGMGTGVLIGNKTVLTAAHMLYDASMGWPNSVTFIPAQNGSDEPYGQIHASYYYVPNEWKQGNQDYDLGLIVLDRDIGQQTGFLQLAVEPDSFYTNQALESAGYPADLGDGYEMYSVTGQSTAVQGKVILHRITTEEGQSGSPIWFMSNNVPTVVGVNVGWEEITNPDGTVVDHGLATRIDEEFGTLINNTLSDHGDITQPNLPAPASNTPKPASNVSAGLCGLGAGQAFLVLSLAWSLCLIRRLFPQI